jgi:hypothetical protein
MLSLTQPSTSGSPPASTDRLDHAVEELLVELRRDRAEVADEADGAGEVPRLAGDEIVLTQGEHSQQRSTASKPVASTSCSPCRQIDSPRSPPITRPGQIRASGACNARSYRSGRWSSLGARSCCRIYANQRSHATGSAAGRCPCDRRAAARPVSLGHLRWRSWELSAYALSG